MGWSMMNTSMPEITWPSFLQLLLEQNYESSEAELGLRVDAIRWACQRWCNTQCTFNTNTPFLQATIWARWRNFPSGESSSWKAMTKTRYRLQISTLLASARRTSISGHVPRLGVSGRRAFLLPPHQ